MPIKSKTQPLNHRPGLRAGPVKWLLGALGVLWASRLALRSWRRKKTSVLRVDAPFGSAGEVNRLAALSPAGLERTVPHPSRGHEWRDADARWILAVILFLLVFGLSLHGILAWFLHALNHSPGPTDRWRPLKRAELVAPPRAPIPALQVAPPLDLQAFRAREDAELNSYGWVNRTNGVVRVPIQRAMELVLQAGLPARNGTNPTKTGPSTYQLMQQRPAHRQPEIQGEK